MRPLRSALIISASLVALGLSPVDSPGAGATSATAELDGRSIAISKVPTLHCHDGSGPVLRCFTSRAARDADLGGGGGVHTDVVTYVTLFADENYGGGSLTLSQPQPNLGVYGWNDRTTSFKSLNGERPKFWQDNDYSGGAWQWAAGAWVANVGSGANDKFSSVKDVP